jgi:magnesium-transporting ATPase (P-type)
VRRRGNPQRGRSWHKPSAPPCCHEGLSTAEAGARLRQFGPNALKVSRRITAFGLLLAQFKSPLVLILVVFAIALAVASSAVDWL